MFSLQQTAKSITGRCLCPFLGDSNIQFNASSIRHFRATLAVQKTLVDKIHSRSIISKYKFQPGVSTTIREFNQQLEIDDRQYHPCPVWYNHSLQYFTTDSGPTIRDRRIQREYCMLPTWQATCWAIVKAESLQRSVCVSGLPPDVPDIRAAAKYCQY